MRDIVVFGNPMDGFTYIGPFEEDDDVIGYAEKHIATDWWIAKLHPPVKRRLMGVLGGGSGPVNPNKPTDGGHEGGGSGG